MIKTEKQSILLNWLRTPRLERNPPTKIGLCALLEVSKPTLNAWERMLAEDVEQSKEQQEEERMEQIKDMLFNEAVSKGKVNAAELYARISGKLVEKNETKISLELNADQLEKVRKDAEDRVRAELTRINGRVDCVPDESALLLQ